MRIIVVCVCFSFFSVLMSGQENRTISGFGNNIENKNWGAANSPILRVSEVNYADGMMLENDAELPSPRVISNELFTQTEQVPDKYNLSDYVWVFGQFLDHDITLVESSNDFVFLDIPENDEYFSSNGNIITSRNEFVEGTGTDPSNPREYLNHISSFIDGSAIYGSDTERASWLRTNFGDGKLKLSKDDLLPWNTIDGEFNQSKDASAPFMADDTRQLDKYFVAGDVRANENPLLLGIHTIFAREHNRLCDELRIQHPNWNGDRIYERARKLVGAYLQSITYNEYLPAMGVKIPEYSGYFDTINPSIFNVFSAAAFRIGHTLINSDLIRMNNTGGEINQGNIELKDAFFNPQAVVIAGGIEPYFKGMATQVMQNMDCKIIDDLRNFLFGAPGTSGGLDLASINIYRGRDRGLSGYNQLRFDFGLPMVNNVSDFAHEADAVKIEALYNDVNDVDAWVGMLAEKHLSQAIFGELVMEIIEKQFQILRDGDRFYYENDPAFTSNERKAIAETTLHSIIMRNTDISLMQKNVFLAMQHDDIPNGPSLESSSLSAAIFPNPVVDRTIIKVYSEDDMTASFKLFNNSGVIIECFQHELVEGNNFIPMEFNETLTSGLYNLLIEGNFTYSIVKMIKQ